MKPVLWIHKASGRIRFDGVGLPESWMPLYSKEELELDPKSDATPDLTDKAQRVWMFVKDRKTPFEAGAVAKHFSITSGSVSKHLHALNVAGLLTKTRKANKVIWAVKHVERKEEAKPTPTPVAVSQPPAKPQPSRPAPVVWPTSSYTKPQTSYPNVRGYDD